MRTVNMTVGSYFWVHLEQRTYHSYFPVSSNVTKDTTFCHPFDQLAEKYGLAKIKTIGDAYMLVLGLNGPLPNRPEAATSMAITTGFHRVRGPGEAA